MASKSLLLLLVPFLLVSSAVAFDITKILEDYTEYSTFLKYLVDTKLSEEIAKRETVTVLVVDNSKVSPLSSLSGDALKKAVGIHVLLNYYDPYELDRLHTKATTLNSFSGPVAYTQPEKEKMLFGNPGAELIKVVAARPFNLSVLLVNSVITDAGAGSSSASTGVDPAAVPGADETDVEAPKASAQVNSSSSEAPKASSPTAEAPRSSTSSSPTEAPKSSAPSLAPKSSAPSQAPKSSAPFSPTEAPKSSAPSESPKSSAPSPTAEAPKSSAPSAAHTNEKSPAEAPDTDVATPSSAPKSSKAATAPAEAPKKSAAAPAPATNGTTAPTGEAPASGSTETGEAPDGSAASPGAGGPLESISSPPMPNEGVADAPGPGADEEHKSTGAARAVATATTLGLAMGAAVVLVAL